MDKFSFFIFNIFINSFLAFFTAVFLIESLIFLCRIQQGRLAAVLRMIPFFKLPFDLFRYDFSTWSYIKGVDPLACAEGTRSLSISLGLFEKSFPPITSYIRMTAPENTTFSLADVAGQFFGLDFVKYFSLSLLIISFFLLVKKTHGLLSCIKNIHSLKTTSYPLSRKIYNPLLHSYFNKNQLEVRTFRSKGSPFVAGLISFIIYVPRILSKELSRKEYEAVLSHELEHIRYKDSFFKLFLNYIRTIFWWIPTKWLEIRIEEGQEVGCDLKSKNYGVDPLDLASAICKSASHVIQRPKRSFIHYLIKSTAHKRINGLLQHPPLRNKQMRFIVSISGISLAFFLVFLGKFWIF